MQGLPLDVQIFSTGKYDRGRSLSISGAEELRNRLIGAGQRFLIRQEDNAKMLCTGLLPEAGAVNYHYVLL